MPAAPSSSSSEPVDGRGGDAIRIARLPATTDLNPYQREFYRALSRHGGRLVGTGSLDPAWLRSRRGAVDVLHLHWRLYRLADPPGAAADTADPRVGVTPDERHRLRAGLELAAELGYRIVWTAHEPAALIRSDHYDAATVPIVLAAADGVAAHDHDACEVVRAARPDVPIVVTGLSASPLPDVDREQARRSLGLESDQVLFVAPGGFARHKRPLELLEAFAQVDDPRLRLVWIGPDQGGDPVIAEARQLALADPRVTLRIGRHDEMTFARHVAAADVAVSARVAPWTNSSLVTAGAAGVPPLMASTPGNLELVGAHGFVFDAQRPSTLTTAIAEAAAADDRRERGRRTAEHIGRTTFDDLARRFARLLT